MSNLDPRATLYGQRAAEKLFSGRKGHGGKVDITRRVLTRRELETICACAFEMGLRLAKQESGQ